jgi:hypothetical protein
MNPRLKDRKRFAWPIFAAAAILAVGAIVHWLWNAILPSVANVNPIGYWQAVGLLILCKILFGGFAGRPGGARRFGPGGGENPGVELKSRFSHSWRRKWMEMSDEERARFKQELKNRWCRPPRDM